MTDPGNYRPIAVLSPFAKILGRLAYNQLSHFIEKENILFEHQFGFRKKKLIILLSKDLENTINEELNHLLSYCSANKLSVNFKKTHYMTISSPPVSYTHLTLPTIYSV